jgi:hypothetical protein
MAEPVVIFSVDSRLPVGLLALGLVLLALGLGGGLAAVLSLMRSRSSGPPGGQRASAWPRAGLLAAVFALGGVVAAYIGGFAMPSGRELIVAAAASEVVVERSYVLGDDDRVAVPFDRISQVTYSLIGGDCATTTGRCRDAQGVVSVMRQDGTELELSRGLPGEQRAVAAMVAAAVAAPLVEQ